MAHTDSAKTRIKTDEKARVANKGKRSAMKTYMKRVQDAVNAGDKAKANAELIVATQKIDKAAKSRVLHPNNAARKKSVLAKLVGKMA